MSKEVDFFRKHLKTDGGIESFIKHLMSKGQQNVHTPFALCRDIVGKLREYTDFSGKKFAVLFNIEFLHVLVNDFGVKTYDIVMFADDIVEYEFCRLQYGMKPGENLFQIDIAKSVEEKELYTNEGKCEMKFDIICGNPPYQAPTENKGAGHTLWDKFVCLSIDNLLKDDGHLCFVHPCGWRRISGKGVELGKKMRELTIKYLEIHDINDGLKTFGVCTRYDWYVIQKKKNNGSKTIIIDEEGKEHKIDLTNVNCIPNSEFEKIYEILAKEEKYKVNYIHSESAYELRKKWMSKEKTEIFKYPCVYSIPQKGIQFVYSSINTNGHFGVPKVIWSNGAACQVIVDKKGEYGLTQWAFGITDTMENLPKIKEAMENPKFVKLCKSMRFTLDKYDYSFIASLKKDFWKEFI